MHRMAHLPSPPPPRIAFPPPLPMLPPGINPVPLLPGQVPLLPGQYYVHPPGQQLPQAHQLQGHDPPTGGRLGDPVSFQNWGHREMPPPSQAPSLPGKPEARPPTTWTVSARELHLARGHQPATRIRIRTRTSTRIHTHTRATTREQSAVATTYTPTCPQPATCTPLRPPALHTPPQPARAQQPHGGLSLTQPLEAGRPHPEGPQAQQTEAPPRQQAAVHRQTRPRPFSNTEGPTTTSATSGLPEKLALTIHTTVTDDTAAAGAAARPRRRQVALLQLCAPSQRPALPCLRRQTRGRTTRGR